MTFRNGVVLASVLVGLSIVATTHADADPPKLPANTTIDQFKPKQLKIASKTALAISQSDKSKVEQALKKNYLELSRDKNATKFMTAGVGLGADADAVYRHAASKAISKSVQKKSRGTVGLANGGHTPKPVQIDATYSIEGGEVTSATTGSCAGTMQVSFTIKNRGAKLPQGTTARLFASVTRQDAPNTVISSAWMNLPPLDSAATTTVALPALRHQKPASNGTCPGGDVIVTPTFIEADTFADYRLRINLTNTGADATLQTGPFMVEQTPCDTGETLCSTNVCGVICPPCPSGYQERAGICEPAITLDFPDSPSTF